MSLPSVTFVLPVRNEAEFIRECLDAVRSQDYSGELVEIIVVDGMSDDGTQDILTEIAKSEPKLKVIQNPERIVPVAMNLGIRQATGEIIIRVDGHAVVPGDYARRCVEALLRENVECVGGAIDSIGTNYIGAAIAAAMSSPFGVGGFGFRTAGTECTPLPVATVPFGAFLREVFPRVGFFNEEMVRHQDYEFNYRLRSAGGRILLLPWLRVKYFVRSNLKALWRQYWGYGFWKGRMLRTYPESIKPRHFIPPLFVLSIVCSAGLGCFSTLLLWSVAMLLSAYIAFLFAATATFALKGRLRVALILPVILAIMHVSWGTGVWCGLISKGISTPSGASAKCPRTSTHHRYAISNR